MYLVVGLGNPGKEYELTRHNIGFRVVDRLLKDLGIGHSKSQCQAEIYQGSIDRTKIFLAKPQTFMNLSGNSVLEIVQWFKIDNSHTIVVCDDLDLEVGQIRIRPKGNSGGHKGVGSVIDRLGTTEFPRIRIGIGKPSGDILQIDSSDYVLSAIPKEEIQKIDQAIVSASEAVSIIIKQGLEAAMNRYNIA